MSDRSLKKALKCNPHVPDYLLGRKKMPRYLPDYYGFGDENEAITYVFGNKGAWMGTALARKWLGAKL